MPFSPEVRAERERILREYTPEDYEAELALVQEAVERYPEFVLNPNARKEYNSLKWYAARQRAECMTVRNDIGFLGPHIAKALEYGSDLFAGFYTQLRAAFADKPAYPKLDLYPDTPPFEGYLVSVPNWRDIIVIDWKRQLDKRNIPLRLADWSEGLLRSPVPHSAVEIAELMTTIDNYQDEAATLSLLMMITEKASGRAIPGSGWVATAADALNILNATVGVVSPASLPGAIAKRGIHAKATVNATGYRGRLSNLRRTGKLKVGFGDYLQGLQATETLFGNGIALGGLMGFLNDGFWGTLKGAEFRFPGPWWDPLAFTEAGEKACYRSPGLDIVHPKAYQFAGYLALRLWQDASQIMPYLDVLGEPALAHGLIGMRLAEQVLHPWLESGQWVEPLNRSIEIRERATGGVEELGTRNLRADKVVQTIAPGITAGVLRALSEVGNKDRQAFYSSLISSIGWGLWGGIEPLGVVEDLQSSRAIRDAFLLADHRLIPRFDLDD